ncbi:MAG: hypothetical protein OHK0052_12950 [Anaerolineales bacterium]
MDTFKKRLPSRSELWTVLVVTIFVTHIWGVIQFLNRVPALILRLTTGEILAVAAYNHFFLLLESLSVVGLLAILAFILPQRWLRNQFSTQAGLTVVLMAVAAALFHYSGSIVGALQTPWESLLRAIGIPEEALGGYLLFLLLGIMGIWMFLFFAALPALPKFSQRTGVQMRYTDFVERASVLSGLFLAIDLLSLFTVIIRNL